MANGEKYASASDVASNMLLPSALGNYIKSLEVQDSQKNLNARGDSRKIKVIGTPGAGFSLTVNDSSGCSLLDEDLDNVRVPENGVYSFTQYFPDVSTSDKVKESYDITITPNADSMYSVEAPDFSGVESEERAEEMVREYVSIIKAYPTPNYKIGEPSVTLHQYPDATITITPTLTAVGTSLAGGTVSKTSKAGEGNASITQTWTVTETEDFGLFYVKKEGFNKHLTKDTVIKKVVSRPSTEVGATKNINLKPLTTRTDENGNITGDLVAGMKIYGKVEKTKIVTASLEVPTCRRKTNKFELSDTVGLFPGMIIDVPGQLNVEVMSVDCARNITVDKKIVIKQNASVTPKYEVRSSVFEVKSQLNSAGEACVEVSTPINVVDGMTLEFDGDTSRVKGTLKTTGSGSNTVTVTSNINVSKFGLYDVAYTLDLDAIVTRTPNARNYDVVVDKNTGVAIYIGQDDTDANAHTKTLVITSAPRSGSTSTPRGHGILQYTPNPNFTGRDKVLYTLNDGTNTSEEKEINITVR